MLKKYRYVLVGLVPELLFHLVRFYSRTYRLSVVNDKPWLDYLHSGGRVLLCCWHQQFFVTIGYADTYAAYHPALMISRSQDGEIIARVAEKLGWHTVRGSSSRGGGRALKEMVRHLKHYRLAAHIVDGPQGPAGIIKAGAISLARSSGAVVVPFYVTADRAWYFNSWDHFMVPKPFAKVTLRFGEMLDLNTGEGDAAFEGHRLRLQEVMLPGLIP
ncbi:MAG: hypothetical protein A4E66_00595 [Syntrophus sp. PtaB.Bin001]|jgi:hypothetical protein|nr:MAG: hypothetical protein A4E66_00595 [Syntrophus sp. PtaB.Bin001]